LVFQTIFYIVYVIKTSKVILKTAQLFKVMCKFAPLIMASDWKKIPNKTGKNALTAKWIRCHLLFMAAGSLAKSFKKIKKTRSSRSWTCPILHPAGAFAFNEFPGPRWKKGWPHGSSGKSFPFLNANKQNKLHY